MPWSRSSSPSRRREVMRPPRSGRTSSVHCLAAILIAPMLAIACGGQSRAEPQHTPVAAVQASPSALPSPSPSAAGPHVFVIVMENRSYEQRGGGATDPQPAAPPSTRPAGPHLFVIVMENRSYEQALAGGYTARLASQYGVATNYHGVAHPS